MNEKKKRMEERKNKLLHTQNHENTLPPALIDPGSRLYALGGV